MVYQLFCSHYTSEMIIFTCDNLPPLLEGQNESSASYSAKTDKARHHIRVCDAWLCSTENSQQSPLMLCCLLVRQLLQALPSRPLSNGYIQQKRLLSSPSSPKKEVLQSIKRYVWERTCHFVCLIKHVWLSWRIWIFSSPLPQEEYVHRAPHPGEERDGIGEPESNHLFQQLVWWQKVAAFFKLKFCTGFLCKSMMIQATCQDPINIVWRFHYYH